MVDYTDNRGDRQRRHFATKKSADAFRIYIEGQLQIGIYRPDASKLTIQQACESFLHHCEGRHRRDERMTRKMLVVYRGHINNHILHAEHGVGAWKLSQLTARAVGEFRDRIRSAGVTVPTARKVLATLHGILEHAISQDWVATNAAHGIKVIGSRGEGSEKIVAPSKQDMRTIINRADDDMRLMLLFAASTGARAGEQWAARWQDVELDKGEFRISRRVDAYGEEGAPKSTAGVRTVPLSAQTRLGAQGVEGEIEILKACGFDLSKSARRAYGARQSNQATIPAVVPLGLKRFNWHGLRHFAVSCWIEAGMTPKTVQTFAGHASMQITMDRYGHLFPSDDHRKAMDQIAKGLWNV